MKIRTSRFWAFILIGLALMTVIGGLTVFKANAQEAGPRVGSPAPDFTLPDLRGGRVNLREFASRNRVTVLNFWATWCPPCRREIPDLVQFNQQYSGRVGVLSVDLQEDPNLVRQFAKTNGMDFTVLTDAKGDVAALYQIYAIPTTFILDRDGIVRQIIQGGTNLATLKAKVDSL